ncbi:hypothetical protein PIB30_104705, partial [Stylosanthes scabra]|nr:hypothetical protein [Stylosanthes scabra]
VLLKKIYVTKKSIRDMGESILKTLGFLKCNFGTSESILPWPESIQNFTESEGQ